MPLHLRVADPGGVPLPADADGARWRRATLDDAPAITALLEAMSRRDHPEWSESLEEVVEDLGRSWIELSEDSALAAIKHGDIAAIGAVVSAGLPRFVGRSRNTPAPKEGGH